MWRWAMSGGILCGADKLSRVAWLQSDSAVAEVLGVEAIASQSTLSRFFGVFSQKSCNVLGGLHRRAAESLPSLREGYTLDLDSWALLHEDGHQAGRGRGLHPAGTQAVSSAADRGVGRKQTDRQLLAAPGRQCVRQRGGGVFASDGARLARPHCASSWCGATRVLARPACKTWPRRWV